MVVAMEQVLDRGGRVLTVREVASSDLGAIEDLFLRLSARSTRQRFLSSSRTAGSPYVRSLVDPLYTMDAVLVESGSHIVGVGSTHPLPAGSVEFAVAVDDADQGHGIGTLLVEALVARARRHGVRTMVGTVLAANAQMFDVLGHLGLSCHSIVEDGVAEVTLTIADDPVFVSAHQARSEAARAEAVRPFLTPTHVAVLPPPVGSRIPKVALACRPEVPVSAIGRRSGGYDVPAGAELALIPDRLSDSGSAALACAEAGIRAIALVRSTRHRAGDPRAGSVLDKDLLDCIHDAGARVLGPGTGALVNTDPLVRLHVGEPRSPVPGGTVAVVTDDATCVDPLRAQLVSRGVGLSAIVDVAVAADLGIQDAVTWLAHDPRTEVILVNLGGSAPDDLVHELGDIRATCKPVALLSEGGRGVDPGMKHIGAGPIRATSLGDLADLAMLLVVEEQPPGRRVAVVTHDSQPPQTETDRQVAQRDLFGPDLTQHTEMRIHFLSPGSTTRGAVIAVPADATKRQVHDIVETLVDDPGVDAVVVDHPSTRTRNHAPLRDLFGALPRESSTRHPTPVLVAVARRGPGHHGAVPVFASLTQALDGLARICRSPSTH
jgi:GNAT superfamily N-acetyltransferase